MTCQSTRTNRVHRLQTVLLIGLLLVSVTALAGAPTHGDKLANNGNYAAAGKAFSAALRKTPDNAALMNKLAAIKVRLGQYKEAVQWAEKAVKQARTTRHIS